MGIDFEQLVADLEADYAACRDLKTKDALRQQLIKAKGWDQLMSTETMVDEGELVDLLARLKRGELADRVEGAA